MKVTLRRLQTGPFGTFGVLELPGLVLTTAELPWRMNQRRVSCIPPGTYACQSVKSPKFGKVVGVFNVPGRDAILMHRGNFAGDTEVGRTIYPGGMFDSHSQGCILIGQRFGMLKNSHGRMQRAVALSAPAVSDLMRIVGDQRFELHITSS